MSMLSLSVRSWGTRALALALAAVGTGALAASAQPQEPVDLELDPEVFDSSPVLRQWQQGVPDIADEILHEPSFPTRLQVGYSQFPSTREGGVRIGVEDVFVWPGTGLTLSGDYGRSWQGNRQFYGAEARYYLLPLGGYVNLAPVVGYRHIDAVDYTAEGLSLGLRLLLVPSRGGGADVAIDQRWVAVGTDAEVGVTRFSMGYGVARRLRLSTDLEFNNSRFGQDGRLGFFVEYLP